VRISVGLSEQPGAASRRSALAPVIGLVGGIGSGKSAVAAELQKHGGYLINADQLGHEALRQPDIMARVRARWGHDVFDLQGNVDRRALGRKVFADAQERAALEKIVFPYIEKRIAEQIETGRGSGCFIVLDAAIMIEAGWARRCDRIIFVDTPRSQRLERLLQQRGWSEEEVSRRERAQMPLAEKRRHADAVIANNDGIEALVQQVHELLVAWGLVPSPRPKDAGFTSP
jgi:dephospho-CoA kinase